MYLLLGVIADLLNRRNSIQITHESGYPFPFKLYRLLDTVEIDGNQDVVSLLPHGTSLRHVSTATAHSELFTCHYNHANGTVLFFIDKSQSDWRKKSAKEHHLTTFDVSSTSTDSP